MALEKLKAEHVLAPINIILKVFPRGLGDLSPGKMEQQ